MDPELSTPWLLWRDSAHEAAFNMAADEALLEYCAEANAAALRIYGWSTAAVSIGCFQKHTIVPPNRDSVRRLTGGGLVEHGDDLTYTLVAPKGHPLESHDREHSYSWVHQAVSQALASCDVIANQASDKLSRTVDRATMACFREPSRYDLLGEFGKLAGAAQRRTKLGLLHQGSIQPPSHINVDELGTALPPAFAAVFGCQWSQFQPDRDFEQRVATLVEERYATLNWQERR